MTAYASGRGTWHGHDCAWELRGLNGKGLDLRLRLPDWIDGLEPALRGRLSAALARGNVTVSLKVTRAERGGALSVNEAQLTDLLDAMARIEARAMEQGLTLAPATAADLLACRGVLDAGAGAADTAALSSDLQADFERLLESFLRMRAEEGAKLSGILAGQLDEVARLTEAAAAAAEARQPEIERAFRAALDRVTTAAPPVDEGRVAQELALLAVKADVTEELDRLRAHLAAARDLLAAGSPVGRKLDFLMQEFNREANTLCSKAQNTALTAVGLELKSVIERMREQVQNVE
ncbi:YicC/YloC family endoribonuclease [Roseovarius salis]|uniref:YicC/YloC family endoribonuclease n=1 Tax=Roseovarius salis TaxID=3376063 RepID=UPI0037C72D02